MSSTDKRTNGVLRHPVLGYVAISAHAADRMKERANSYEEVREHFAKAVKMKTLVNVRNTIMLESGEWVFVLFDTKNCCPQYGRSRKGQLTLKTLYRAQAAA